MRTHCGTGSQFMHLTLMNDNQIHYEAWVRDPLVMAATLPRFLAPGDDSRLLVEIDNVEGAAGDYEITAEITGPIATDLGANRRQLRLEAGERRSLRVPIRAGDLPGDASVVLRLSGPDGPVGEKTLALGVREVQVWKDVDGILTADPRVCAAAVPVPRVSYSEAAELAYFGAKVLHPVAMQPAVKAGMPVRVKNSYNSKAPGTLITKDFTAKGLVSAITSKSNVVLVDVTSTRMLGAYGFLSTVFDSFKSHKLSVDVVATSEVSVSVTLNKPVLTLSKVESGTLNKLEARSIEDDGLRGVVEDLDDVADVQVKTGRSQITLIANVAESSNVMAVVFQVVSSLLKFLIFSSSATWGQRRVMALNVK